MKLKIGVILILLISFVNINCFGINKSSYFYNLESDLKMQSIFAEDGTKFQYITKNSKDTEIKKIKNIFRDYTYVENEENGVKNIRFYNDKQTIQIYLWYEEGKQHIEIILLNKNKNKSTKEQYYLLDKLDDGNIYSKQFFYYYKGKINNSIINKFLNKQKFKDIDMITINNGCTGIAVSNKDNKINFAEVHYNTGSYIIIASPIIFTTY